ncbi:site-specific DNA-methyltransferase [Staphylococcus pseudintermedius]|uniref:DNA-methyltransferase n=1 Tax=Staphylococcus pseudintermedius TaxID=283734 RepID=UPI000D730703|nr:site-specific DNA-methyltransferase [Staphylococcus pseudintermedius]PXA21098.1 site-specific DNA-methyltransferase [Staphylococcus pseudintermedius]
MRDLFLNKVTNIDCVEGMERLPDNSIDLTVTSPPYDNLRDYDGYNFDYKKTIEQLYRVTKLGGMIVWVVGDATIKGSETGSSFKQALEFLNAGFKLHDTMIYKKNTSSFPARRDGKRYTQIFEYMFVFSKGKPQKASLICDKPNKWAGYTNWGRNTQRGKDGVLKQTKNIKPVPTHSPRNNIWEYSIGGGVGQKDKLAYKHPATFPLQLASDHILSWSDEKDVVLDTFIGSGTTAIAAIQTNRNFIGFDISEQYCELSRMRIETTLNENFRLV